MKIAIACDHAGFPMKELVIEEVRKNGHEATDLGTSSTEAVDYPDYAEKAAREVQQGAADRGIIICGSGVGAAVTANKLRGIRAGLCHDTYSARQSVEHDNANMLALGARIIGPELVLEVVRAFLGANFTGEERHVRRVAKIMAVEQKEMDQEG